MLQWPGVAVATALLASSCLEAMARAVAPGMSVHPPPRSRYDKIWRRDCREHPPRRRHDRRWRCLGTRAPWLQVCGARAYALALWERRWCLGSLSRRLDYKRWCLGSGVRWRQQRRARTYARAFLGEAPCPIAALCDRASDGCGTHSYPHTRTRCKGQRWAQR